LERALGHERQEGVALGLRTTAVRLGQDDVDVLSRGADGDPAEAVGGDVVADLEAERVPVEAERGVRVVDGDEHGGNGDGHATTVRVGARRVLLRSCSLTGVRRGRVATMLTHAGTTSTWRWSRARYCDGVSPTISVNRELNEAERRAPDREAGVGDRHPLTQQRLCALDASGHEVGVGRLAVCGAELAREVRGAT